jgi:predicted RNA-binding Zn-ribbon protein involved in translation (DUF1610 family)
MLTTRTPEQKCPKCGKKLDSASSVKGNHKPEAGDFTVCISCNSILTFETGLTLSMASDAELRKLSPAELFDLVRTQTAIREMHRQRQRANARNN